MFINNFDPVALEFFSFEIRWYSLSYIFGIVFAWIYCKKFLIKDEKILNLFDDFISYAIIGLILGGRLGYIIFYNLSYYSKNILEIFMIWKGGMSFHGGLLGVIFATYIFSKKNNIKTFLFLDLISMSAPIGIFLGRIANFINSELYGREADLFWSVKIEKVDNIFRHPSQIYEAFFEGLILFIILIVNFIKNKKEKNFGVLSGIFLLNYGIFRFFLEYLREPDTHLGLIFNFISMGQLLCLPLLFFGILLIYYNEKKK